jgi:hypothetical protein
MSARFSREELEDQTARRLEALRREFGGDVPPDRIAAVGSFHFERLLSRATVTDFIPLLVYRCTKEELLRDAQPDPGEPPDTLRRGEAVLVAS